MFVLAHVAARGVVCCVYVGFLCTCMHAFCCVAFVPFSLLVSVGRPSCFVALAAARLSLPSSFLLPRFVVAERLSWSLSLFFSRPVLLLLSLMLLTMYVLLRRSLFVVILVRSIFPSRFFSLLPSLLFVLISCYVSCLVVRL